MEESYDYDKLIQGFNPNHTENPDKITKGLVIYIHTLNQSARCGKKKQKQQYGTTALLYIIKYDRWYKMATIYANLHTMQISGIYRLVFEENYTSNIFRMKITQFVYVIIDSDKKCLGNSKMWQIYAN